MPLDERVIGFLRTRLEEGHDIESIKAVLLRANYAPEDVADAIERLTGKIAKDVPDTSASAVLTTPTLDSSHAEKPHESPYVQNNNPTVSPSKETLLAFAEEPSQQITPEPGPVVDPVRQDISTAAQTSRSPRGYFSTLWLLLFSPHRFIDMHEERSLGHAISLYTKTLLLILPLNVVTMLLIDNFTSTATGTPLEQKLLLFILALITGYIMATILIVVLLVPMHALVYLFGGRLGIARTYQSFFYAVTPFVTFLWLPVVNAISILYTYLLFYEFLKRDQQLGIKQAFWSIALGSLGFFTLCGILYQMQALIM